MITITAQVYRELAGYCISKLPEEACGLLSGREGVAETCWPITNREESPIAFTMDEAELDTVLEEIERSGEELMGMFHSHPTAVAKPSEFDKAHVVFPCSYMILSLASGRPRLRSFQPLDGDLVPERITILYDK
ncbi:Mov34/MPN/PAD-1 family protein [Paenibacillus sp. 1001270B_150601_E10]|uniref:Mov34/MPN/PAD-1 family protein n=1 Tax=Paenibacillus sp. 1001270B_150601_E10 TaxID=2787079 RepID=UPI00189FFE59|nr:M67 family metallopeptidase [Paenibacillus sp. 1001270B_150601_E10]